MSKTTSEIATDHVVDEKPKDKIFITKPDGLLVEDAQLDDPLKDVLGLLAGHSVTDEEYQALREHPLVTRGKAAYLGGLDKAIALIRRITPFIKIADLPTNNTKANTALEFRWEPDSDQVCLERIRAFFNGFSKVSELKVIEHPVLTLSAWPMTYVISPVDALLWLGLDPSEFLKEDPAKIDKKAVERYCEFLRHLSKMPGLELGSYYQGAIKKDGAIPHPDCLRAWMKFGDSEQESGSEVLFVHHMPVNPAVWFDVEGETYSIAPIHTPKIINDLPVSNRMKQVAVGDMIAVGTFLATYPFVLTQIAAGTCPRIDVAGTKLRGDGGWSGCPGVYQRGSRAYLGGSWAGVADEDCGSFVCASGVPENSELGNSA